MIHIVPHITHHHDIIVISLNTGDGRTVTLEFMRPCHKTEKRVSGIAGKRIGIIGMLQEQVRHVDNNCRTVRSVSLNFKRFENTR